MVGGGRMGEGLARALSAAGSDVALLVRTARPTPPGVGLSVGDPAWRATLERAPIVLVATPDSAIAACAEHLARLDAVTRSHVVLHLSGLLDRSALAALAATAGGLGSLHPLQAVADPAAAPELLRGAFAAVEGDDRARAAARAVAELVGLRVVELDAGQKASYHAAAALVSNYTVTLADLARRIAEHAGIGPELAERMYLPLLRGTVTNIGLHGAAGALTGAIRRGDAGTVAAHLAALAPDERHLYAVLGLATLRLARSAGLEREAAEAVETVLRR